MAKKITDEQRKIILKKEKAKKEQLPPIKCKGCTIVFTPVDKRQHFHSPNCRETFYNLVYYGQQSVRKICKNCGSEFITSKPGRQDYCLPECREEHKRKVKDGIAASVSAERSTFLGDRFATLQAAGFKCSACGKGVSDGIKLDVEDNGEGGLRSICNLCVEGRKFNESQEGA